MGVEIIRINDNTWRIEDDYVRFFVLEGKEKALLIDSGVDTPNAKEIAGSITCKPLILLNTHGDVDHVSGNGSFETYYIGEKDYLDLGFKERFPNSKPIFLNDGDELQLGDRPLKIIAIPGHTSGSVAVLDVNERALYSGDTVSTAVIYMFGYKRSMPDYVQSLKKLDSMKDQFDVIYASHGEPELKPDAIAEVQKDLEKALAGKLPTEDEELYGEPVTTHRGSFCGFYLPR